MSDPRQVTFFMERGLCDSAAAGQHNFIGKVVNVLRQSGHSVAFEPFGLDGAHSGRGQTLSHMKPPPDGDGLVFRRVYHYPFWQIEATARRENWDVAHAQFIDPQDPQARPFYERWQSRLFGDLPQRTARDGFIYVPLQGRLLEKRSFQKCSPVDMLRACINHATGRRVVAALHPKETYSAAEMSALSDLDDSHSNLSIQLGGMEEALRDCDFVATQTSAAAFNAMFFGKASLLFGNIDFHHVCIRADTNALGTSFDAVADHSPDFAAYVHWFWQLNSINAGHPNAEDTIAARLRRFGWNVHPK